MYIPFGGAATALATAARRLPRFYLCNGMEFIVRKNIFVLSVALIVAASLFVGLEADAKRARADAVSVSKVWNGSVADGFAGGAGTETDPYLISDGAELAYLAREVNAGNEVVNAPGIYYKLTEDIILNDTSGWENWGDFPNASEALASGIKSWTPIGKSGYGMSDSSKLFMANFDGGGNAVKGIYINTAETTTQGLFGALYGDHGYLDYIDYEYVFYPNIVQNTGVEQSYIRGVDYVGALAGYVSGYSTIKNCYNAGGISNGGVSGGEAGVGGIAGLSRGSIIESHNAGSVTGGGGAGGIVGRHYYGKIISGCYNTGTVAGGGGVGGIAGSFSDSGKMTDCYNLGAISGTGGSVGGIAGSVSHGSVSGCYNKGDVTGGNTVGGVAGHVYSNISNCYNTGSVSAMGDAGGVTGMLGFGSMTNCYNTGAVTASSADGLGFAGGLTGRMWQAEITNCYNAGGLTGAVVGGVAGLVNGESAITNCYSAGVLIGVVPIQYAEYLPSAIVGGAAGFVSDNDVDITNLYFLESTAEDAVGYIDDRVDRFLIAVVLQFDTRGCFTGNNSVTIGGASCSALLAALNAWLTENQTEPAKYSEWRQPQKRYPTFAWDNAEGEAGGGETTLIGDDDGKGCGAGKSAVSGGLLISAALGQALFKRKGG